MAGNFVMRSAVVNDRAFILDLVPRFVERTAPRWRTLEQVTGTIAQDLEETLAALPADRAIFIAEDWQGNRLGFISLGTVTDLFTQEPCGYISDLAVIAAAEGQGVGRALMHAGEAWARQQGYRLLTLNAFPQNERARSLYRQLGFEEDLIKYIKPLL
ncbi:GNAT family N-acetyltransferase [Phormidium tenue FACHB-886]|nr:GNAT family N-acetyltransferase [Phormidium tenue FACHB-886]